ncbi:hypothetical protein HZ326_7267 [Fusarium oxysporum f. sp. albedinis]|nr:hypothetical protein HZ326_7267 [Fusarium oxysporum f. sp. albedinis]
MYTLYFSQVPWSKQKQHRNNLKTPASASASSNCPALSVASANPPTTKTHNATYYHHYNTLSPDLTGLFSLTLNWTSHCLQLILRIASFDFNSQR